jgi:hypothetical protein
MLLLYVSATTILSFSGDQQNQSMMQFNGITEKEWLTINSSSMANMKKGNLRVISPLGWGFESHQPATDKQPLLNEFPVFSFRIHIFGFAFEAPI